MFSLREYDPYLQNNRELFIKIIKEIFPFKFNLIMHAHNEVENALSNVLRRSQEPQVSHVRAVALIDIHFRKKHRLPLHFKMIIVDLHHESHEDTDQFTSEYLAEMYGRDVATDVWFLSKPPYKSGFTKIEADMVVYNHLKTAPHRVIVSKICDRFHYFRDLNFLPSRLIGPKLDDTKKYLLPLARKHKIPTKELEEAMLVAEKKVVPI